MRDHGVVGAAAMSGDGAQKRSADAPRSPFATLGVTQGVATGNRPVPPPFGDIDEFAQVVASGSGINDPRVAQGGVQYAVLRPYSARMLQALRIHPDSRSAAVTGIEVEVSRQRSGVLALRFIVSGNVSDLKLPPIDAPKRTDELWRHTCFETFVRAALGGVYYEFNFAPSTQWALYRFTGYRGGMSVASAIKSARLAVRSTGTQYELRASLELGGLRDLAMDASWRVGVSAVIEEMSGTKSYWALTHPPGKADFHHSDSFSLELPAV